MDLLQNRVQTYFQSRTKGGNGILKDYISTPDKSHRIFYCDNDYLNLSSHESVLLDQIQDLEASIGRGIMRSSVFLNDEDPHTQLERDMGNWFGKSCYLAQSGYAANVGLMHAICSKGQNVYVDKNVHMSFYDGLAARQAKIHTNKPNDMTQLEANIREHGSGMILVESIYSNTGDYAPLGEIVRIKKKYNCILVVDESHSFGVCGSIGFVHLRGLDQDVDFVTASLAKAYATRAGIVFAPHALYVKENSFPYIFSSALTRNDIIRIRAVWEVVKAADDRRARLLSASKLLCKDLSSIGRLSETHSSTPSHIVCIKVRNEEEMARLHRYLSSMGILTAPFFYPAVPVREPILRLTIHCDISKTDIQTTSAVIATFFSKDTSKL